MINLPSIPKPENPAFFDRIIVQVQDTLKANLSWLNYSFGQSQKLIKKEENRDYFYPAVYIRKGHYQNVEPSGELGNFSFFVLNDPQQIDFNAHSLNSVKVKYSLIFWFNVDTIFHSPAYRNTEELKEDILEILTRKLFLTSGRLNVDSIYEGAKNIFSGYSIDEAKSQYLMQPYAGFRFDGELLINEICR